MDTVDDKLQIDYRPIRNGIQEDVEQLQIMRQAIYGVPVT